MDLCISTQVWILLYNYWLDYKLCNYRRGEGPVLWINRFHRSNGIQICLQIQVYASGSAFRFCGMSNIVVFVWNCVTTKRFDLGSISCIFVIKIDFSIILWYWPILKLPISLVSRKDGEWFISCPKKKDFTITDSRFSSLIKSCRLFQWATKSRTHMFSSILSFHKSHSDHLNGISWQVIRGFRNYPCLFI